MQTLRTANAVFTLSPTRNVGELQAKLAKCNGKTKRTSIRGGVSRNYPTFTNGMSTADYVALFEALNNDAPGLSWKRRTTTTRNLIHAGYFAPLNTNPCTLYTGEDSFELVEEMPDIIGIEATELTGEALDIAYAEFEALAA